MQNLPNIFFDCDAQILFTSSFSDPGIRESFIGALHRGDRINFYRFCAEPYDPNSADFLLFHLTGFQGGDYAFLEKNLFHGQTVNIVYFTSDVAAFYPLMSPTSQFYRDVTGRTIHDILRISYEKTTDAPFLTPSAFLAIDRISYLRDELLKDPRQPEYCDLRTVIEKIVDAVLHLPTFARTDIRLHSVFDEQLRTDEYFDEASAAIIEFSLNAYVFLLTALLHIFYASSEDHFIDISLSFAKDAASTDFRVKIPDSRAENLDSSSLITLNRLVPGMDSLAKIAAVVAYDAKINTILSYNSETGILQTSLVLDCTKQSQPTFHYRDPYTKIPDIVEEFSRFFENLLGAA